ncbi:MAG: undecaprenyldiphospho-muramoylpentapeptide beta-N-acetylglucosaminyltransferase [Gammaproteobacteria bacterium]|nr:undecaprenyldiphospho-muramoylpentapeptide beta-N-acetylglucosaminyltransferase [Gammaproteobacteria bacterium]
MARVMIMAGGTGGHVYPALAVAAELRKRGSEVFWLGTPNSFEAGVVPQHGIEMASITISGLRGNGLKGWLQAPYKLLKAMNQAARIMRQIRPDIVLGMGGFVSGPGGLVTRLLGLPLVIHEQNAVPGLTNQLLSRVASRVLEAFPGSFVASRNAIKTGNPVRADIIGIAPPDARLSRGDGQMRLLVLGGSQGAQAINQVLPEALARVPERLRPQVRHQAGRDKFEPTLEAYRQAGVSADVQPFIDDMAATYGWADLVICRAGALTVAELGAVGVGSVLIPFPYAVDDHQTRNAHYLADEGAAILVKQEQLNGEALGELLIRLAEDPERRMKMAQIARRLGLPEATGQVADICEEVAA